MNPFLIALIVIETLAIIFSIAAYIEECNRTLPKYAFLSAIGVFVFSNITMWAVFVIGYLIAAMIVFVDNNVFV